MYVTDLVHTFHYLFARNDFTFSPCFRFWAAPTTAGGKASIEVRQMSQIALERAFTAVSAIQIMGDLATKYGFYAADWSGGDMSKGECGEALTVIDRTRHGYFTS